MRAERWPQLANNIKCTEIQVSQSKHFKNLSETAATKSVILVDMS